MVALCSEHIQFLVRSDSKGSSPVFSTTKHIVLLLRGFFGRMLLLLLETILKMLMLLLASALV